MLKKSKPDLSKNGEFKKNTPAKSNVKVLSKEAIRERLSKI